MQIKLNKDKVKKVFILEDDDNRIKLFQEWFDYADVLVIVKKSGTALECLNQQTFDIVFLDHDLEEEHYTAFNEGREPQEAETGLYVAKRLRDTPNGYTTCIIHSMNPVGAANMIEAHPFNTIHVPFYLLKDSLSFQCENG